MSRRVPGRSDETVRLFVEHWGMMARSWGINATMGELFALLYITGGEWTADALKEWLDVSRGNVSMNLRELMSWGVVHKVHRQGERREFYRAETDVWTLFRRILFERKRRELDPTLVVLERTVALIEGEPAPHRLAARSHRLAPPLLRADQQPRDPPPDPRTRGARRPAPPLRHRRRLAPRRCLIIFRKNFAIAPFRPDPDA